MQVPGYRDLTVLGRGGFSTVYRAVQESVLRDVALKVLAVHMAGADAKLRFRRECATNGRVGTHPNIVTLFDSGFADDGSPFLAMQLCAGGSLSERLREQGPLPVADVLRIGVKISAALAYAHSAGVLHRDIKPENILMTEFGEPELADFGISSVDDQKMSTVTASSFTINHAAPEALEGQPSSVATDIYSLCSTLYTLVAGHTPFVAPSATGIYALVNKVMTEIPPATGRADVPASLERLLAAGLAKTPAGRPADAKAVGSALQDIQRELGLPVTEFPSAPPPLAYSPTQTLSDMDGSRRGSGAAVAGAGIAAAGVAGAGIAAPGIAAAGAGSAELPPTGAMPAPTRNPAAAGPLPGAAAAATGAATGQWGAWAGDQQSPAAPDPYGRNEPPVPVAVAPVLGPPVFDDRPAGPPDRPDRRAWWIAGAIVLVLLIATGVYLVARSGRTTPATGGTTSSAAVAPPLSASSKSSSAPPSASTRSSSKAGSTPPTTSRSTTTSASTTAPPAVVPPTITGFGSSSVPAGGTVKCTSTNSSVDILLVWSSDNATQAWIGVDISGDDASKAPYDPNGVATSSTAVLPFPCSAAQHSYTLTVKNATGTPAVSRKVTFVRALPDPTTSKTSASTPPTTTPSTTTSSSSSSSSSTSTSSSTTSTTSSSTAATTTSPPASTPATS